MVSQSRIGVSQRIEFYGFLIALLESGKGLQEACEEIDQVVRNKATKYGVFSKLVASKARLYGETALGLRRGKTLAGTLMGRVPDNELMMLVAGGRGNIIEGLRAAHKEAVNVRAMHDTLIKGVMYPSGIFVVLLGMMYWMGQNLFPSFADIVPVDEWGAGAQRLYWMTTHIHVWVPLLMVALIGVGGLLWWVNRNVVGPVRERFHLVPPFNVVRAVTGANLLSTLVNLTVAGEPMKEALERITSNSTSPYLGYYAGVVLDEIRSGRSSAGPGAALQINLFDLWTQIQLEIYGRGSLADFTANIEGIAEQARTKAQKTVGRISMAMNIAMMMTAGGIIISALITIYSITETLRSAAG